MVDTEGDALEGIGRKFDLDGFDSKLHVGVRNVPVVADALHRAELAHVAYVAKELLCSFERASVEGVDLGEPVECADELVVRSSEVMDCSTL